MPPPQSAPTPTPSPLAAQVGEGSYANVYKGRLHGYEVAIKCIRPPMSAMDIGQDRSAEMEEFKVGGRQERQRGVEEPKASH